MKVAFCDSSALVKLIVPEHESLALKRCLREYSELVASAVALVEVPRAVDRRHPSLVPSAVRMLESMRIVPLEERVSTLATRLPPAELRSLDAIQLASALDLAELEVDFIAYDQRLLQAASRAGSRTLSPMWLMHHGARDVGEGLDSGATEG